jgi:hypothetical protein
MIKSLVVHLTVVFIGLLAGQAAAQDTEFSLFEATISDIQDAVGAEALTYESLVALSELPSTTRRYTQCFT